MASRRVLASAGLMLCGADRSNWMGDNFEMLRHKTLLEITLPGSHNSGNYQGGLHSDLLHGHNNPLNVL